MSLHVETPLIESMPLSASPSPRVWLKLEAVQPTGSFKIRGIGHACEFHQRQGARRFVSSSGGNAGLAVAYAGRKLGVPVTVVVPETTGERAKSLIRLEGAEVVVCGKSWQEAHSYAQGLTSPDTVLIHPFDDTLLWTGHATLINEVADAQLRPDAVVLAVGGGGLLSGVLAGMHQHGWADVPVLAAETEGAASYAAALQAGEPVELAEISSVATSLGARRVCNQALHWAGKHRIISAVVSDAEAVAACRRFADDHRLLVEPACGAALALAYGRHEALATAVNVLVIVCGGVGVTLDQLEKWRNHYAA